MTTYFVTRHPGAVEWARRRGIEVDQRLAHLDPATIEAGDIVAGTLPINLAADVCRRGGRYLHLTLEVPAELRGSELSADDMEAADARLEVFRVEREGEP